MAKNDNKANNAIVIADTDDSVTVLDALRKELKSIKSITETQYRTTGVLEGFGTPIQNESKMDVLICMYGSVTARERIYNDSQEEIQKELGAEFPAPPFKISSFCATDYKKDIILRIKVLTVEDRKKELESLIKEGEKFLTEKDQKKIWLNKIQKAVGSGMKELAAE